MCNICNIQAFSLFKEKYEIPIYQRNYSWESRQIEQLIDDILDNEDENYFIGSLVVNVRDGVYEVVDGQQRLTTLFLLFSFLNIEIAETLRFEARKRSNYILSEIQNNKKNVNIYEDNEIMAGYRAVKFLFESKKIERNDFIDKLRKVHIVRVQVPEGIDLNHYFEIMNTRGEQLELHEIAKGYFLKQLSGEERIVANIIWGACMNMDSYVQMNLTVNQKDAILTPDRDELKQGISSFDEVVPLLTRLGQTDKTVELHVFFNDPNSFVHSSSNDQFDEEKGSKRFDSILRFPQFLLHVNAAIKNQEEDESVLDDKRLLDILQTQWATRESSKEFIFSLLRYRLLFDKYIIKRDKKIVEEGKWSLLRPRQYSDSRNAVYYVSSFGGDECVDEAEIENYSGIAKNCLVLQSALRITYTSPKTMYWITAALKSCGKKGFNASTYLNDLEKYAVGKVKSANYRSCKDYTDYQRIVFSYLDYVLFRDGFDEIISKQEKGFEFQYRNSIEHFYPQHPINKPMCPGSILNSFGNLALITTSDNSRFSNLDPVSKKNSYPAIISQSLKLRIMAKLVGENSDTWIDGTSNVVVTHGEEMFKILDSEVQKNND